MTTNQGNRAAVRMLGAVGLALVLAAHGAGAAGTVEDLLSMRPLSLDVPSSVHEGRQPIIDVPRNMETLYGTGCVLEVQFIRKDRPERFPSRELDYVPIEVNETTTLREFLDHACSEGQLQWEVIRGAIHIRPPIPPTEKPNYLDDVRISLDLEGASVLEAIKAWATAVNRNRPEGTLGVSVSHPSKAIQTARPDRATPESLTRPGAVTVRLEDVTAREALCAIVGASSEWTRVSYHHGRTTPDTALFFARQAEINAAPEVSIEERIALNAEEDLDSVLVEPAVEQQE